MEASFVEYTVFTYKNDREQARRDFATLNEAFTYLASLDLANGVDQCMLDGDGQIMFDLRRNGDEWESSEGFDRTIIGM